MSGNLRLNPQSNLHKLAAVAVIPTALRMRGTPLLLGTNCVFHEVRFVLTAVVMSGYIVNRVAKRQERTTAVFAALADPTRRHILVRLSKHGETRVTDLAQPFAMALPSISKHLRVLEKARLIRRERHGREHMIQANLEGMREAQAWIAHCTAGWAFSLDTLDGLLKG